MPGCLSTGMLMFKNKVDIYWVHFCTCERELPFFVSIDGNRHMGGLIDFQVYQQRAKEGHRGNTMCS